MDCPQDDAPCSGLADLPQQRYDTSFVGIILSRIQSDKTDIGAIDLNVQRRLAIDAI
jgi:hypothetical protein